jgi:hypothetical protein
MRASGKDAGVILAASTVAIVAIAAVVIVALIALMYIVPRGGRKRTPKP